MHRDTVTATTGESSDFTRRAFSAAWTVAWLASNRCASSSSWRPKAFTTRMDSSPCCTTPTRSLSRRLTSRVAFLTALRKRMTNRRRKGATPTAMSAKSQLSQNIRPSIPVMVKRSTTIPSVEEDAKPWMVAMSSVMVLRSVPVWCVS